MVKPENDIPRASAIALSNENTQLMTDYVAGLEKVLFLPGNSAITIKGRNTFGYHKHEGPEWADRGQIYAARLAFLHLDDAQTPKGPRPCKLIAGMYKYSWVFFDIEMLASLPEEEVQATGYDYHDGMWATVLDTQGERASNVSLSKDGSKSHCEFTPFWTGDSVDYNSAPGQDQDIVEIAYQADIDRITFGSTKDAAIVSTRLDPFRTIVDILQRGEPDSEPIEHIRNASATNELFGIFPETSLMARRCQAYLRAMFKRAVESPQLRDDFAFKQYLETI